MEFLIVTVCMIAVFVAGFYSGYTRCSRDMINNLTDMVMENISDLTYEVVGDQHYLYYAEGGGFASQGASLDEAAKNFSIRDKTVGRVHTALGTAFFIVDGKIETQ